MDLRKFIQRLPRHKRGETIESLAKCLDRSVSATRAYISGARRVPPDLYEDIEAFTKRKVTMRDLVNMAKQAKADKTVNQ